ncbi:hypothetical protein [Pediococcus pentosaceus]|uniref:hypothetical protein n=1 Tax=Pediococcus pentosaceus TaxID=1255 RepID=UPI0020181182|nr:hypothetical protein [Pediococcus pentosaceus]MCL3857789.1 hypothetical protein [Pediococcus pentosaceus]
MKLVKIDSDLYLNTDFIEAIEVGGEGSTDITMKNGEVFSPNVPIKKVLDAICGSEEHLEDSENKYNISITTDNTGSNKVGTRSQVLSLLDQLKNDETLTIKLTKQKSPLRQ